MSTEQKLEVCVANLSSIADEYDRTMNSKLSTCRTGVNKINDLVKSISQCDTNSAIASSSEEFKKCYDEFYEALGKRGKIMDQIPAILSKPDRQKMLLELLGVLVQTIACHDDVSEKLDAYDISIKVYLRVLRAYHVDKEKDQ